MSFFSGAKNQLLFVTKNFSERLEDKSNIVLSPEFYWVKKVSLNVRFSYEVKKMAPSIFDGILPHGEFEYKVFKLESNEFIIIAYDLQSIIKELQTLGIDMSLVDKIYAVQSEFLHDNITIKVNDKFGLLSYEGILVYSPLRFLDASEIKSIEDVFMDKKLSSNYLFSQKFDKIKVNKKELNLVFWIFILLNAIVLLNIAKLQIDKKYLEEQKQIFIKENNTPTNSFQLKSMQNELSKIENPQKALKEGISYVDNFKLKKNEYFDSIKFYKNTLVLSAKLESKNREDEFKKYLSKKLKILKSKKNNQFLIIEVQI